MPEICSTAEKRITNGAPTVLVLGYDGAALNAPAGSSLAPRHPRHPRPPGETKEKLTVDAPTPAEPSHAPTAGAARDQGAPIFVVGPRRRSVWRGWARLSSPWRARSFACATGQGGVGPDSIDGSGSSSSASSAAKRDGKWPKWMQTICDCFGTEGIDYHYSLPCSCAAVG